MASGSAGGQVTFVNPRRIRAVELGLGDLLQIRPDTDLYFLAAMLTEIDRLGGWDDDVLREHARNVEGLREFIAPFDADSVAGVTGLDADDIRRTARAFSEAPDRDRAHGHRRQHGPPGHAGVLAAADAQPRDRATSVARVAGCCRPTPTRGRSTSCPSGSSTRRSARCATCGATCPRNLLADYIEAPTDPLRALLVIGGNPIMAIPGEERLRETFPQLELIVTIDLYRSATAELSDYVLPVSDWLERADYRCGGVAIVPDRAVQRRGGRTDRGAHGGVVDPGAPRAGARPAVGARRRLRRSGGDHRRDGVRRRHHRRRAAVAPVEHQGAAAATVAPIEKVVAFDDGRVDCCPPSFAPVLDRARAIFAELEAEPADSLKLIQWRNRRQHNTWGHRMMPGLRDGDFARNPLFLHPDDAAARGLAEGCPVTVRSEWGSVDTVVGVDPALRRGVVALSHGYGERSADEPDDAEVGVNVNRLLPSGPGSYEPYSNMAFMVGIPVELEYD